MAKNSDKVINKFGVNNPQVLESEFYREYNFDYWLYKINLLKSTHNNVLSEELKKEIQDFNEEQFKRMLRTELHFLYFQMTETLFEIIFALAKHDNRYLWLALSFSNERNSVYFSETYKSISELAESRAKLTTFFKRNIITVINGEKTKVPLIRWLFYFIHELDAPKEDFETSLSNIETLLYRFAKDFSDRGEYNAYKHSLRFYNASHSLTIRAENGIGEAHTLGSSLDSIIFLEEYKKNKEEGLIRVAQTTKPFDFECDLNCCFAIYHLIRNLIQSRKHTLLNSKEPLKLFVFSSPDIIDSTISKLGVSKTTITV